MSQPLKTDPAFGRSIEISGYSSAILSALPGAAVFVFDLDLRVLLVEGDDVVRRGMDARSLEGRTLPEVLPAESWAELKSPYEDALAGKTSTVDFCTQGTHYRIRVSPLHTDGQIVGALAVSHDVTEQRRLESLVAAQDALARDSERLLATAFDRASIGMSVIDLDGRWLRVNEAYCRMLGYAWDELSGKTFQDLTHPDDVDEDVEWISRAAAGETESLEREKRYIARDGSIVWVHVRSEMIRDDDDNPAYAVSLLQNITARRNSELALRASEQRLRSILDNTPSAVSVKNQDHRYQLVNASFERRLGLDEGSCLGYRDDQVLPASVVALDRETDDRVLQTGEPTEQEEVLVQDGEDRVYLTVKFPLRDEDSRVYAVCGISNDITDRKRREDELRDRLTWSNRIHAAISSDRLLLYAQPIVNLSSGSMEQAELLVRMRDTDGLGLIPPDSFLPAAERFDFVGVIDQWVVARALRLAKAHRVAINLSGKTISDPEQVIQIERLVAESSAPPEHIVFEITETAVAEDLTSARSFVQRLRKLGCMVALDDFGVGFGAFSYLKHLPVDYLKIDIEFVRELVSDETDRQVVRAMVGVARDFGMKTIAEGVEDQATLELLRALGVDYAQGYWTGRPVPVDKLWPVPHKTARTTP